MLPPFDAEGNLPPGIHAATWDEFSDRYGWNERRRTLLVGLKAALDSLQFAGCRTVYVDGSFVTAKEEPADFDACWGSEGVDATLLDPVLLDFSRGRALQKAKFGGELFIADQPAHLRADGTVVNFLAFFQADRANQAKGIVMLDIRGLGE